MNLDDRAKPKVAAPNFSRRTILLTALLASLSNSSVAKVLGLQLPLVSTLLGRPNKDSISVSLLSSENVNAKIVFGLNKKRLNRSTNTLKVKANVPKDFLLEGIEPNIKYYYRVEYLTTNITEFKAGQIHSFNSFKSVDRSFSFTLQGDTHPERVGKMFNSELYEQTLANIASQNPDFHFLIGDDFSIDPLIQRGSANRENVEKIYLKHRRLLEKVGSSSPLFLINGNHEQAAAYLLDGTQSSPAILAGHSRLKFFPLPAPDDFYTGNKFPIPSLGLPRDYYAWTWGNALFVTLDPYWHSKSPVDNVASSGSPKKEKGIKNSNSDNENGRNLWEIGIGDEQYFWLKETLEKSDAKFKFVLAHHVMGTGRGGIELSYNYEWGGNDPKGLTTFAKERPNWDLPIHDLMVKNQVTIFFQGHDHIFVKQERDGIIYQSLPNPADDTFSMFNENAYKSGIKAPNSGHLRVKVNSDKVLVEYFLSARRQDTMRRNLEVAYQYEISN